MQRSLKSVFALAMTLLLSALPSLDAVGTQKTHRYFASVLVEVHEASGDPEVMLRKHLPANDSSVTLKKVRNTELFEIGVTDFDGRTAARRANEIANSVKAAFAKDAGGAMLIIRERAEPPKKPVDPKAAK